MSDTDPLLDALRDCARALPALADGTGNPTALAGALLPDVPAPLARRALAAAQVSPPEPLTDPQPALSLALAATLGTLDPSQWRDHVLGLTDDAACRPHAWAHLSEAAATLDAWLSLRGAGRALVSAVFDAGLAARTDTLRAKVAADVVAAARRDRLAAARGWLVLQRVRGLDAALDQVDRHDVAMAAAEGVPDALARVILGDALDGEVTIAVLPAGVLVEWDGDGPPPHEATLDARPLTPAAPTDSRAVRAWWLAPETSGDALVLRRDSTSSPVTPRR